MTGQARTSGLAGTLRLTRLAARRDRVLLPGWIAGMAAFLAMTTAMFVSSLVTLDDKVQEAEMPTNNAGLRMLGVTTGPTVGSAVLMRGFVTLCLTGALMSVLAVVRHTRQSEELGRAEVVGSTVVGRYAELAAAIIVTVAANILLAIALGLAMIVNGQPAAGGFAAGAGIAAVGIAFTGVAAVTVQLASTTRGAIGIAASVLGVGFLIAGVGNMLGTPDASGVRVTSAWPVWLTPIGWAQQMRPFGGDHWWPLLLFAVLFAGLLAVAGVLASRRDVGAGVWPQRQGHDHASASLLSPAGLVLRLQRSVLIGWTVAMAGFGLIFGALTRQIQDVHGKSLEFYDRFGGREHLVDAYAASMASLAATCATFYVVQIMLRMRADESEGTLESLLASGVTRRRWVLGYVVNALGGAVLLMAAYSLGHGLTAGQVTGDVPGGIGDLLRAGLVQLPAILVVGSCVLLAVGLVPRLASPIAWIVTIAALLLGPMFGPALGLSERVIDISPFTHVPTVPATGLDAAPLLVMTGVCVLVGVVGAAAIRRRNLGLPA